MKFRRKPLANLLKGLTFHFSGIHLAADSKSRAWMRVGFCDMTEVLFCADVATNFCTTLDAGNTIIDAELEDWTALLNEMRGQVLVRELPALEAHIAQLPEQVYKSLRRSVEQRFADSLHPNSRGEYSADGIRLAYDLPQNLREADLLGFGVSLNGTTLVAIESSSGSVVLLAYNRYSDTFKRKCSFSSLDTYRAWVAHFSVRAGDASSLEEVLDALEPERADHFETA
jgi:hypothetical protein